MTLKPPTGSNLPRNATPVTRNAVDYGAVNDGTTLSATGIQAAITSLGTTGGTVFLPPGDYNLGTSSLVLDDKLDVTLQGEGGRYGKTRLLSHMTGSGSVISARSTGGLRIDGLSVYNDQATFTGKLLDLSRRVGGPQDTGLFRLSNLNLTMISQASSSAVGISLNNALSGHLTDLYIIGGKNAIRGRETLTDFSNSITVANCYFQGQDTVPIANPYQMWRVIDNTFEPLRSGAAGALLCEATLFAYGLAIERNWMGDANTSGTWFQVHGYGVAVERNMINSGATGVKVMAFTSGLFVNGNLFSALTTGIDFNGQTPGDQNIAVNAWDTVSVPIASYAVGGQTTPAVLGQGNFRHNVVACYGSTTQVRAGNFGGGAAIVYLGTAEDTALFREAAGVVGSAQQLKMADGLKGKTVAGVVSDGSFTATPVSGTIAVDETNSFIYVRVGSTWKKVAVT